MIIILRPGALANGPEVRNILEHAAEYDAVSASVHSLDERVEIHLVGDTQKVPVKAFCDRAGVARVVRVSEKYRLIGKHMGQVEAHGFDYRGVHFGQDTFHVFAGLCAVDTRASVEATFRALAAGGVKTARMGAYKPRTSPYDFQGHGKACLPYVFELAGKYGISVVAMEILRESHIDEIRAALRAAGDPTGVMLQIGTRNAQNFELLKQVGRQKDFPVLFKRGMGLTLDESLNACEYIASEGNRDIVFCLRGVKSQLSIPHRNLVDFAHVPVIKRLTRLPVCIDPSHSTGGRTLAPDGLTEVHHAAAEGVILGANMILADVHPSPSHALCDGPQALTLEEVPEFLEDIRIVRQAYLRRVERVARRTKRQVVERSWPSLVA